MTKKELRQAVYNKYGGKCAYCGCDLAKGWHVDHLLPVSRRWKTIRGHWSEPYVKGMTEEEMTAAGVRWIEEKTVSDGMDHPERDTIENMIPACASCNIMKHSQSLEGFRATIAGFVNSLNSYTNQYKFAKRYGLVKETDEPVVFYFEKVEANN